jgi:hypothetical protein
MRRTHESGYGQTYRLERYVFDLAMTIGMEMREGSLTPVFFVKKVVSFFVCKKI